MFFKKKEFGGSFDYLIVGLGNPGIEYENTRHNAGFMCIDYIANKCGVKLNKFKHKAYYAQADFGGKKVILVKPQTYMNNSGEAVVPLLNFFKIDKQNLIVVCDDISLDVGCLRIRRKGSDGGQKGMRSIIDLLGFDNFARVKVGIGKKPNPNYDLAKWVLSKFKSDEQADLDNAIKNSASAVELIVKGQIDKAMNNYNS
ncbi:MAG: aminoacyl-tRNA hydrolase [Clostridia bacterium]|nr:aminoacyl-tRNA hydrolase [Clostridia bacterium]